jgi:hypothetical protein
VTRSDRRCQVTETELKRHRGGARALADGFGNLPPQTRFDAAKAVVERTMACLSPAQRASITPRMKWDLVESIATRKPSEVTL